MMSSSKVVSVLDTEMFAVKEETTQLVAPATTDQTFAPSVWGDFFITYTPPNIQRSKEWMREQMDRLKRQVCYKILKTTSVADTVTLVDVLERLGIDNHFRNEIAAALHLVHREEQKLTAGSDDGDQLHIASLRFRLLRQHGLLVSADVFDKFKDSTGCFRESLSNNTRGLLSLYNAADMAMPGEQALDDAIAFSRRHLRSMQAAGKLRQPMAKQVSRALDIPLPRTPRRLETMRYIDEYDKETAFDSVVLELARPDFELVRSLHLRELKTLSLWWRDLYDSVKLSYTRDRIVELFFWSCGVYYEENYSRSRIMLTKIFGLISMMDDTYDAHATLVECHKLNEAIQRWDKRAVSILPEYLRVFYINLLSNFDEMEDSLEPNKKHRVSYAKTAYKKCSECYLHEVQWLSDKHVPSFAEHLNLSFMSSGIPALAPAVLMGVPEKDGAATVEAFDWVVSVPDLLRAGSEVARFLNDIASYKGRKKNKNDVQNLVECYMAEHGVSGEAAVAAVAALSERSWRTINRACVEMDPTLLPAARLLVNLTSTTEVVYLGGKDGYTSGTGLKGLVTDLFLDPVHG